MLREIEPSTLRLSTSSHFSAMPTMTEMNIRRKNIGNGYRLHQQTTAIANTGSNHWIALVLDFQKKMIQFGDSMAGELSDNLKKALEWWTHLHSGSTFTHGFLPISQQHDGYSCGLLAWNALAAYILDDIELINPEDVAEEQLRVLLRIVDFHLSQVYSNHLMHSNSYLPP